MICHTTVVAAEKRWSVLTRFSLATDDSAYNFYFILTCHSQIICQEMLHLFCTSYANKDTVNKHEQRSSVTDRLSSCSSRSEAHRTGRFFHTLSKRIQKPNLSLLTSGGSRIFQTGVSNFLTSFPQICVKIKKNWTKKGCIAGAPLWVKQCPRSF